MAVRYIAQTGINWPDGKGGEKRAEIGEEVPAKLVKENKWLLEQGCVKVVDGGEE